MSSDNNQNETQRLQSFRPPRDFTLNNFTRANRKVARPNIPVKKKDAKPTTTISIERFSVENEPTPGPSRPNTDFSPNSKRRNERPQRKKVEFVQTASSIFAEGVGGKLDLKSKSYRGIGGGSGGSGGGGGTGGGGGGGGSGGGGGGKSGTKDAIGKDRSNIGDRIKGKGKKGKIKKDEEDPIGGMGDFINDNSSEEEEEIHLINKPVSIPLWTNLLEDDTPFFKIHSEMPIRTSPDDLFGQKNFYKIMAGSKEKPTFAFLQIPDKLPILEENTATDSKDKKLANNISNLREGLVGKVIVYESGRSVLKIGENIFEINQGFPVGFRQDLVKIDTEGRNFKIIEPVTTRFIASPDIESLLSQSLLL